MSMSMRGNAENERRGAAIAHTTGRTRGSARTHTPGRTRGSAIALAAALAFALPPLAAANATHSRAHLSGRRGARLAATIDGRDIAHLHLVRQHGRQLFEEGEASGVMPGHMKATLTVGPIFKGSFTIDTSAGAIYGHGSARPKGTGRYQSFAGTMYVSGGSGRYRRIKGRTGLYGTFDRRTFDVIVKTQGRLFY